MPDPIAQLKESECYPFLSDAERVMVLAINQKYFPAHRGHDGKLHDGQTHADKHDDELPYMWRQRLQGDLQAAIQVELATIPIYLYTYYSLNRTKDQGPYIKDPQQYINQAGGTIMSVAVEEMLHMTLSSNIYYALFGAPPQLYCKAPPEYPTKLPQHSVLVPKGPAKGADASKIPLAPFSFDQLWKFILIEYAHQPTPHTKDFLDEALNRIVNHPNRIKDFLKVAGWPADRGWSSIGQFYSFVRCVIASRFFDDRDFQGRSEYQVQHYNYSPNNIDTIYPSKAFTPSFLPHQKKGVDPKAAEHKKEGTTIDPKVLISASEVAQYPNEPNSASHVEDGKIVPDAVPETDYDQHELRAVWTRLGALAALETICEQGEGFARPGRSEELWDNETSPKKDDELSHFDKFLSLQMQLKGYCGFTKKDGDNSIYEELPWWMRRQIAAQEEELDNEDKEKNRLDRFDVESDLKGYIADFATNPKESDYKGIAKAVNDLNSGLFQYMLIMTETLYKIPPGYFDPKTQTASATKNGIENQKYFFNVSLHRSMIWVMDKLIGAMKSPHSNFGVQGVTAISPTFSNYDLQHRKDAYENLLRLGNTVRSYFPMTVNINGTDTVLDAPSFLDTALPKPDQPNTPMQLPDVSKFWDEGVQNPTMADLFGTMNNGAT